MNDKDKIFMSEISNDIDYIRNKLNPSNLRDTRVYLQQTKLRIDEYINEG